MKVRKGIELGDSLIWLGGEAKGQRLNIRVNRYIKVLTSELIKVIVRADGDRVKKLLDDYDLVLMTVTRSQEQEGYIYNSG